MGVVTHVPQTKKPPPQARQRMLMTAQAKELHKMRGAIDTTSFIPSLPAVQDLLNWKFADMRLFYGKQWNGSSAVITQGAAQHLQGLRAVDATTDCTWLAVGDNSNVNVQSRFVNDYAMAWPNGPENEITPRQQGNPPARTYLVMYMGDTNLLRPQPRLSHNLRLPPLHERRKPPALPAASQEGEIPCERLATISSTWDPTARDAQHRPLREVLATPSLSTGTMVNYGDAYLFKVSPGTPGWAVLTQEMLEIQRDGDYLIVDNQPVHAISCCSSDLCNLRIHPSYAGAIPEDMSFAQVQPRPDMNCPYLPIVRKQPDGCAEPIYVFEIAAAEGVYAKLVYHEKVYPGEHRRWCTMEGTLLSDAHARGLGGAHATPVAIEYRDGSGNFQWHMQVPTLIEAGSTEYPVPDDNAQIITLACTLHQWGWWRFHSFRIQILVATPPALCNNLLRYIASKSLPRQTPASICDVFNFPATTFTTIQKSTVAIADAAPEPRGDLL